MTAEFLSAIWRPQGEGFAELRAFGDDNDIRRAWYKFPDQLPDLTETIQDQLNGTYNVFAGVLLREKQDIGTAENCKKQTPVLWADFDTKLDSRLVVFHRINTIDIPPQIVVDSGHGFHCYWLLDKALDTREAQAIMKEIAYRYSGDVVGDPARIMRVPGTTNLKGEAKDVRLVRFNPYERVRQADFIDYIPVPEERVRELEYPQTMGEHNDWISARLAEYPPKGTRSEYIFGIICAMVRGGWTLDQIYEGLVEAPAGEKVRDLPTESGFRWVKTSYKNALEAIALES